MMVMEELKKLKLDNEELQKENTRMAREIREIHEDARSDWQAGEFLWTSLLAIIQVAIVMYFLIPLAAFGISKSYHGEVGRELLNLGLIFAAGYLYLFAFWYWFTRVVHIFRDELVTIVRRTNIALRGARVAVHNDMRRERDTL